MKETSYDKNGNEVSFHDYKSLSPANFQNFDIDKPIISISEDDVNILNSSHPSFRKSILYWQLEHLLQLDMENFWKSPIYERYNNLGQLYQEMSEDTSVIRRVGAMRAFLSRKQYFSYQASYGKPMPAQKVDFEALTAEGWFDILLYYAISNSTKSGICYSNCTFKSHPQILLCVKMVCIWK